MTKGTNKFIFLAPRILAIIFIVSISLFSLDIFGQGLGFWPALLGLLIHNIPSLLLLAVLLIAWKTEIIGTIVFVLMGIAYLLVAVRADAPVLTNIILISTIALPLFVISLLFYLSWKQK